jgi:hypothetical protein
MAKSDETAKIELDEVASSENPDADAASENADAKAAELKAAEDEARGVTEGRQDFNEGDAVPDYVPTEGDTAFTHVDGRTYEANDGIITGVHPLS